MSRGFVARVPTNLFQQQHFLKVRYQIEKRIATYYEQMAANECERDEKITKAEEVCMTVNQYIRDDIAELEKML